MKCPFCRSSSNTLMAENGRYKVVCNICESNGPIRSNPEEAKNHWESGGIENFLTQISTQLIPLAGIGAVERVRGSIKDYLTSKR